MNHYEPRHAKTSPFTETARYKALVLTAAVPVAVGVAATGGAVATHYRPAAGVAYALAVTDHSDPYHSDPGGEWVRIETPESGSTAITMHVITGPGD